MQEKQTATRSGEDALPSDKGEIRVEWQEETVGELETERQYSCNPSVTSRSSLGVAGIQWRLTLRDLEAQGLESGTKV